ncbi:hypothetical protein ACFL4N_09380, partial [Thermodesulfobacteriota bacterium]
MSVVLMTIFIMVLIYFIIISKKENIDVILFFITITFIYACPRLPFLMLDPHSYKFSRYYSMDSSYLNMALLYLVVGTMTFGAGLFAGSAFGYRKVQLRYEKDFLFHRSFILIAVFTIIIFSLRYYAYVKWGYGRFFAMHGTGGLGGFGLKMVNYFLFGSVDTITFIFVGAAFIKKKYTYDFSKKLFMLLIFIYIAFRIMKGSKAGIYYLLLYFFIFKLILDGDFKLKMGKVFLYSIPVISLSIVTFFSGWITRKTLVYGKYGGESLPIEVFSDLLHYRENPALEDFSFEPSNLLLMISRRLTFLDTLEMLFSDRGLNPSKYVSTMNSIKATINLILPGEFFPDSYPTSRLFAVMYHHVSFEFIKEIYNTPILSVWGATYIHWGWIVGSIMMFVIAFFIGFGIQFLKRVNSKYRLLLLGWGFWNFHNLITAMGFEDSVELALME